MAEMDLQDILTDHAYCEQKAATNCITIIQRFGDHKRLVREIAPIVTEEWGHFRQVIAELDKRGLEFGRQRKDEYVNKLRVFARQGGDRGDRLMDQLIVCAMIEARSAERFRLLSLHISEVELREFYHRFMVSEAGHYRLFLDLAMEYQPKEKVMQRWEECLAYEAEILKNLEVRGDRMH
jgi:tRNA-(ms[2]io[6]A)-hydroxylase